MDDERLKEIESRLNAGAHAPEDIRYLLDALRAEREQHDADLQRDHAAIVEWRTRALADTGEPAP